MVLMHLAPKVLQQLLQLLEVALHVAGLVARVQDLRQPVFDRTQIRFPAVAPAAARALPDRSVVERIDRKHDPTGAASVEVDKGRQERPEFRRLGAPVAPAVEEPSVSEVRSPVHGAVERRHVVVGDLGAWFDPDGGSHLCLAVAVQDVPSIIKRAVVVTQVKEGRRRVPMIRVGAS